VLQGNTIEIRLARGLSSTEERRHVESLLRRMRKMLVRERAKRAIDPFRPLLEGQESLLLALPSGRHYEFLLRPGARTKAKRTGSGWLVDIGPGTHRRRLHRFLWLLLSDVETPHINRLVHVVNAETLRVRIGRVRLRYAATQWGSCSARGDISLNPALLFLPAPLLRYVIIHELGHRLVRSHSRAYWRNVERVLPTAMDARKELRNFRLSSL
jgi:predicted metal-dependent hydrolase